MKRRLVELIREVTNDAINKKKPSGVRCKLVLNPEKETLAPQR